MTRHHLARFRWSLMRPSGKRSAGKHGTEDQGEPKSADCSLGNRIRAGPVLRAGLTDVPVIGIPIRRISVRPKPLAMGANPAGARLSVAPSIMSRKKNVRTVSAANADLW